MIDSFLNMLANSSIGVAIAEDPVLFPWIEVAHVLAITIVFGSILLVDLRLVGLAGRDYPISRMSRAVVPLTWVAFIIAVITGSLLFVSNPVTYFGNFAFRAKIALMLCAGVNMAIFHVWTMRSMRNWDETPQIPLAVRFAGLISIVLWVTIIVCGRWIGFTMAPF
ncbi:MAG: hypothetical protein J7494_06585 [Sphingobium sp.]|nr:hypothetical protein [Sphingobium sp.]